MVGDRPSILRAGGWINTLQYAGRHLYELTAAGRDLRPALHALLVWGGRHRAPNSHVFKHGVCGTPLDDTAYCTAYEVTARPEDILVEPGGRRRKGRDDPVAIVLRGPRRLLQAIDL